jgi:fermentation-respiration switch protein FrsA (DUF1100 family)
MSLAWLGRPAVVLLVVGGVVSCGADPSQETTGPYRVASRSVTFVDDSRPTPACGAAPAQDTRTIVTDIWYPAAGDPDAAPTGNAPAADGPFPVIVFNHGQQGEPQQYGPSFETWARAGYVVAAPRHPLTVRGGPGCHFVDDIQGETGDVAFVISSLDDELSDLADVDHLAVAGHSSGAIVAYAVGFNTCCHDDRVDAVMVEGLINDFPLDGDYAADLKGTPVMFMHGDADPTPIADIHAAFDAAEPPKYLLSIPGGDHSNAYRSGPSERQVATTGLAFFDLHLKDRAEALNTLQAAQGVEAIP